jgi:hypothetical protein
MNSHPIAEDVARLVCGNIQDLQISLQHETDQGLLERALTEARELREGKTKAGMIERALRRLRKTNPTS